MSSLPIHMTALERRAVSGLAAIFAVRLLGLFLILPVFALYAEELKGNTPVLAGLALGIYGLTQAILQIPFGMASDRWGRKPAIVVGLVVFILGSVLAALSDSIYGVIIGRALQGAGAISAAVIALAADLTREDIRTRAMAAIGISIGASFVCSFLLAPILNNAIGVAGIFWLTATLGLGAIILLVLFVPTPLPSILQPDTGTEPRPFMSVLRDTQLLRLNIGILILHAVLTALFVVLPAILTRGVGLPTAEHWKVYLMALSVAVVLTFPAIMLAEKKRRLPLLFSAAVLVLALSQVLMLQYHFSLNAMVVALVLFFLAFNVLEAALPSLVAKAAPGDNRGTAIGIYSTFQFLGAFIGGVAGGWIHGRYGITGIFFFNAGLAGLWFLLTRTSPARSRA